MVGLEEGGVKVAVPMLPTASPPLPPFSPSPEELPKGEIAREGGTGDSEANGVKVCAEKAMRGMFGREGGRVSWLEGLTGGENG